MNATCANVSMTGFEICTLFIYVVSYRITDEYDCLHNNVPTNPNKLAKKLTKNKQTNSKVVENLPVTNTHVVTLDPQVRPEPQRISTTNQRAADWG